MEKMEIRVIKEIREIRVFKACREFKDLRVTKEFKDQLVLQVQPPISISSIQTLPTAQT